MYLNKSLRFKAWIEGIHLGGGGGGRTMLFTLRQECFTQGLGASGKSCVFSVLDEVVTALLSCGEEISKTSREVCPELIISAADLSGIMTSSCDQSVSFYVLELSALSVSVLLPQTENHSYSCISRCHGPRGFWFKFAWVICLTEQFCLQKEPKEAHVWSTKNSCLKKQ